MRTRVYTTHQAAKKCHIHRTAVMNWISNDKLKAYTTPGRHRHVMEAELIKFIKKYQIPLSDSLKKQVRRILIVDDDKEFFKKDSPDIKVERI